MDRYIKQIPDYSAFGRKATLRMNPDKIPDLLWKLVNMYHTTNIGQTRPQAIDISTLCIDVDPSVMLEELNMETGVEQLYTQIQLLYRVMLNLLFALPLIRMNIRYKTLSAT